MKFSAESKLEKIGNATLEDAKSYQASSEQFTWCIDWLEISAHDRRAEDLVNILEDYLVAILIESTEIVK